MVPRAQVGQVLARERREAQRARPRAAPYSRPPVGDQPRPDRAVCRLLRHRGICASPSSWEAVSSWSNLYSVCL